MNKILITIYVVSLDETYDVFVPVSIGMNETLNLIQDSIVDLSNGNYKKNDNVLLYNSNGYNINTNNIVKFSGLVNGARVVLV